ncbi:cupredoxin domain-containing protein [Halobacteriovorax sp.]|uniref:cupredoxin domain-containing protein n=1 Tax=Halobacteriovorax sp. TaxID=2020862 RepID=UPI003567C85F
MHSLEETYLQGTKFDNPERMQSVIVTNEGFYPHVIHVFSGETMKLFVTSTTNKPSCLTIPKKNVFLSANRGEVSESTVIFSTPGVYEVNCPVGGIKGKIVVQEHPISRRERIRREIASEKRVKIWRPRDE